MIAQKHAEKPNLPPLPDKLVTLQLLPALNDGGVEQSCVDLAEMLVKSGHEAWVVSKGGHRVPTLEAAGARHVLLPVGRKAPWWIVWHAYQLTRLMRRVGVQIVHARSRAPAWAGWLACWWTGVPFVTTFHGTYSLQGGKLKRWYNSVMLKGPIVIANSRFIADHIIEKYGIQPERVVVAPRGIDPATWNPTFFDTKTRQALRATLQVPTDSKLILMVGRLTRWKGHGLLLHALAALQNAAPQEKWVLAVAGGADREDYFEELQRLTTQLGLTDRVRWLGSRRDVPALLSASDLAVSPSLEPEAFGRVAIEAMAMGVPVVATALGGSLETIVDGSTGWLVHGEPHQHDPQFGEFTPQALAEKLLVALQPGANLSKMSRACRDHVLRHFTVAQCCAAEMQGYALTLAAYGPPAPRSDRTKKSEI